MTATVAFDEVMVSEPGERITGKTAEFIDFRGHLAQCRGNRYLSDRPILEAYLAVSRLEPDPRLIGRHTALGSSINGWTGGVYVGGGLGYDWVTVATDNWQRVIVHQPVPKPRDGKHYTWRWDPHSYSRTKTAGGWVQQEFPFCHECQECHSPELPYCTNCGRHHKPGQGPKYSDGSRCTGVSNGN